MEVNKIIQGDCLEVMKEIDDKSIDMILADLPYGTTACKWDTIIPFEPLWEQYKRIIKDNGAIVLTASQPFTSALVMSNIKWFKYEWIWEKEQGSNFTTVNHQPFKAHENILVFSSGKITYNPIGNYMKYNPQKTKGKPYFIKRSGKMTQNLATGANQELTSTNNETGDRHPLSYIYFQRDIPKIHPTQKPVALFEYLIKTYTNEGDLVLDNCAGGGTTGVACKNLNRNYILIEKEPEYIEIIKKRLYKNTTN
jgi:site-specific DNA-methyltransferase (adenine-specific)